jgi:hypothetical protein
MHLVATVTHLERIERGAARGLAAAQTGKPAIDAERLERAAHGFHFAQLEILVETLAAPLPESAVLRLELGHRLRTREALDVERQLLRELLDELIGLWKEIARVDEDHRDLRRLLRHQVQRHGGLRAEARGQCERSRQVLQ